MWIPGVTMRTLEDKLQKVSVWKGSLQLILLDYTLGPHIDSNSWFSSVIHFLDVLCMEFRINQYSGATPRRADFLESFFCEHNLILFSSHAPLCTPSPPHTAIFFPSLHCVIPCIYSEIRFTPTQWFTIHSPLFEAWFLKTKNKHSPPSTESSQRFGKALC